MAERQCPAGSSTLTDFTSGWTFRRETDPASVPVDLPHDAMLFEGRSANSASGVHGAHFLGGRYVYSKRWTAPSSFADRRVSLFFEGVYGDAEVLVNGMPVGGSVSGYTEFDVALDEALTAGDNTVEVRVDNSQIPNSRWYTGAGIYRRVWLRDEAPVRFRPDGVRFLTSAVSPEAVVDVDIALDNPTGLPAEVRVTVVDEGMVVADAGGAVCENGRLQLVIVSPSLWSDVTPHLYTATVQLIQAGELLDQRTLPIGLRTIEVDAISGLRVNGNTVKLRGACVHHDSGVLGAATFRDAEYRRARILKANGFNAIRSAHNPLSRDLIDACDEVGLYVIDELTDVWTVAKTRYDSAQHFQRSWRSDVRAMVAKDRNHACVIMYSVGNEIAETATPPGVALTGELSRFVKELDPTRPTTLAVNFLLNVLASFNTSPFDLDEKAKKKSAKANSTAANVIANKIGGLMHLVARLPRADSSTRAALAEVDVAGYNYGSSRHRSDAMRYPKRVMVGSETMPGDIAKNWARVTALPSLIGDFMWTGWDYLGEAGIGSWNYGKAASVMNQPYPHLLAGSGAIDITGVPGAPTLLSRAVWGELSAPAIAVRPLDRACDKVARSAWRSTDAIASWAWRGAEGEIAEIEVYSADDEIEIVLNGRSLGRAPAGPRHGHLARFRARYEPGEIVAIGRRKGRSDRRTVLRSSAGDLLLRLTPDRRQLHSNGQDLAFVAVDIVDSDGVVEMLTQDQITIEVTGAGSLAGFGSAAPRTTESYLGGTFSTYYGRSLAVVRAGANPGGIHVRATGARFGTATVDLDVASADVDVLTAQR